MQVRSRQIVSYFARGITVSNGLNSYAKSTDFAFVTKNALHQKSVEHRKNA